MHFNALEWIAAIGGVLATVGAWRTEATARWQARAELLRTDRARAENELHRQRYAEVWNWRRSQPPGEMAAAARWFGEWTGTYAPFRSGIDQGPQTPGLHSGNAEEAYLQYLEFLGAVYQPGRLGRPRPLLRGIADEPDEG